MLRCQARHVGNFSWFHSLPRQPDYLGLAPLNRMPRNVRPTAAVMLSPLVDSLVEAWQDLGIDRTRQRPLQIVNRISHIAY